MPRGLKIQWLTCRVPLSAALKLALVAALLALDPANEFLATVRRFATTGSSLALAGYTAVQILGWVGLVATVFVPGNLVRGLLLGAAGTAFLAGHSFYGVTGRPLGFAEVRLAVRETGSWDDALLTYGSQLLGVLWWLVPVLLLLYFLASAKPKKLGRMLILAPFFAYAATLAVCIRTVGATSAFPTPYALPANAIVARLATLYEGPRWPVQAPDSPRRRIRHLVLIVDESVRGDYIDDTALFFGNSSPPPFSAINYGPTSSATNCSSATRLLLRSGLQSAQLPDLDQVSLHLPSIWQYARKAGMRTVFLDGQSTEGRLHSYMNVQEAEHIDTREVVDELPPPQQDPELGQRLNRLLRHSEPSFIYVAKHGVHSPYERRYPNPSSDLSALSSQEAVLHHYREAVRWSVNSFFEHALRSLDLADTVLIYTSDHGQNLYADGLAVTHCRRVAPTPQEALVPLLLLTGDPEAYASMRPEAMIPGTTTHFQIFPSLLHLLGYDPDWIEDHYGPSLNRSSRGKRRFFSGNLFGFGGLWRWNDFDPEREESMLADDLVRPAFR